MEKNESPDATHQKMMVVDSTEESRGTFDALSIESATIHVDPEKEKAVLRKFDKWLLPQVYVFILLNYLDRSNLGM